MTVADVERDLLYCLTISSMALRFPRSTIDAD
jgi:hypothetical protein